MEARSAIFIRLDKIGDLVSTLPCDEIPELKDYKIIWAISKSLNFVTENAVPRRESFELDKAQAWKSFWKLLTHLKNQKPELAVSFQAPWWVSLALWLGRVPERAGRLSQWHSFLFFNRGLRQKRSQSLKHEADYNLDLVHHALKSNFSSCPVLKLKAPQNLRLLEKFSLKEKSFFVVHPGMAGSALNWPVSNYIELTRSLLKQDHTVIVTGTAGDEVWLTEIKEKFKSQPNFRNLQNQLSPTELLSLLSNARAVLAPSTGVLHLAAALGVPTVGIYSPVLAHKATRWRARGPHVDILEVPVGCKTTDDSCMEQIPVSRVLEFLLRSKNTQVLMEK